MKAAKPEITAVKRDIFAAFKTVVPPPADKIVVDQSGIDLECAKIRHAFEGRNWKDIDKSLVMEFHDALPLFTPQAYRYFLPAYMINSLEFYYEAQDVVSNVILSLTPPETHQTSLVAYFRNRALEFSNTQCTAIVSFISAIEEADSLDWGPNTERVSRTAEAMAYWAKGSVS